MRKILCKFQIALDASENDCEVIKSIFTLMRDAKPPSITWLLTCNVHISQFAYWMRLLANSYRRKTFAMQSNNFFQILLSKCSVRQLFHFDKIFQFKKYELWILILCLLGIDVYVYWYTKWIKWIIFYKSFRHIAVNMKCQTVSCWKQFALYEKTKVHLFALYSVTDPFRMSFVNVL